jgi:hypothetical protein
VAPGKPSLTGPEGQNGTTQVKDADNPQAVAIREPITVSVKTGWRDNLTLIFSGLLILIAAGGVFIGLQSLGDIHTQAGAAKATAEAALKQSEVAMNTERAWIFEELNFPDILPFQPVEAGSPLMMTYAVFKIENPGRSVARITNIKIRFHKSSGILKPPPYYDLLPQLQEIGDDGFMLAPNQKQSLTVRLESGCLSKAEAEEINRGDFELYAYGLIEYETLGIQHTTQFCYTWNNRMGLVTAADKGGFRKGGPPGYNKST